MQRLLLPNHVILCTSNKRVQFRQITSLFLFLPFFLKDYLFIYKLDKESNDAT